jgi:hypothetical protein
LPWREVADDDRDIAALVNSGRLPGAGQGERSVVKVARADGNHDGKEELYVSVHVDGPGREEAWYVASYRLPYLETLWSAPVSFFAALPAEASCFGAVHMTDLNGDSYGDVAILRTCHDTVCPESDSADAECRGPASARDIGFVWQPAEHSYVPVVASERRATAADCERDNSPVIFCQAPKSTGAAPTVAMPDGFAWQTREGPMASIDGGEFAVDATTRAALARFVCDQNPVRAADYDACVRVGRCPRRAVLQPASAVAAGMSWEGANAFCVARGMHAPSPEQNRAIRDTLGPPTRPLIETADREIVDAGFRCALASERFDARARRPVRGYFKWPELATDTVPPGLQQLPAGWWLVPDEALADYRIEEGPDGLRYFLAGTQTRVEITPAL